MKKKVIVWSIVICLLFIVGIIAIPKIVEYVKERARLAQEPYFTEYKLTEDELEKMVMYYWVEVTPAWSQELNKEEWPDFSYYTMDATEETEMVVVVLNYWLFEVDWGHEQDGIKKAEQNGFSPENPVTVDWVLQNPREAISIIIGTGPSYELCEYNTLEGLYQEIVSGSVK